MTPISNEVKFHNITIEVMRHLKWEKLGEKFDISLIHRKFWHICNFSFFNDDSDIIIILNDVTVLTAIKTG